jgi:hypothetical protein
MSQVRQFRLTTASYLLTSIICSGNVATYLAERMHCEYHNSRAASGLALLPKKRETDPKESPDEQVPSTIHPLATHLGTAFSRRITPLSGRLIHSPPSEPVLEDHQVEKTSSSTKPRRVCHFPRTASNIAFNICHSHCSTRTIRPQHNGSPRSITASAVCVSTWLAPASTYRRASGSPGMSARPGKMTATKVAVMTLIHSTLFSEVNMN